MRSYGVFHPARRDKIVFLALAKSAHFSHATQLFGNFGVFLYFQEKSIALATYLTLLYSTNIKLGKKQNWKFVCDFIRVRAGWRVHMGKFSSRLPI